MTFDQLRQKYPNLSDDAIADLAEVSLKLSGEQKTRKGFLGLLKQAEPNRPIPEIDEVNAVEAKLAEERKARENFEAEQRNRWLQEDLSREKSAVREKHGLSDEDMTAMEKMMTEKKLPADYNWAASLYKQQTEVATPTNYGTGGYGPFDIKKNATAFEGLMEDTDNWASRTAHEMIDEMQRAGKAKTF